MKPLSVIFNKSEDSIVSCSDCIIVWNVEHNIKIAEMHGHTDVITGLSFNENEEFLASCSKDKSVILWNMSNY